MVSEVRGAPLQVVLLPPPPVPNPTADDIRRLAEKRIDFVISDGLTAEALLSAGADAVVVVGGEELGIVTGEIMDALPACWAIVKMGSGVDMVHIADATERGILVANTPQAVTDPVSDHAVAMLFAAVRRIRALDHLVRSGGWLAGETTPGRRFTGATVGLIGFGRVARAVRAKLSGFDMRFLVYDPYVDAATVAQSGGVRVELDDLLRKSDFVSIHCPLTDDTYHLIGERELRIMKSESVLSNLARGAVVDQTALYRALKEGWIAGAALDVLEKEPPDPDNPLFGLDNVVLTPHIASMSSHFPGNVWDAIFETLLDLAHHRWPESVVNPKVKPRLQLS